VIVLGDSIAQGAAGDTPIVASGERYVYQHQTWLAKAALSNGIPFMAVGAAGYFLGQLLDPTNALYTRFSIGTVVKPTDAIIAAGTNDLAANSTQLFGNAVIARNMVRASFGVKGVVACTVGPRNYPASNYLQIAKLTVAANVGDTILTTDRPLVFSTSTRSMGIGVSRSATEYEPLTGSGNSTGTGPYVTPLASGVGTGSIAGATMTIATLSAGSVGVTYSVTGPGVAAGTTVTANGTGTGGVGNYTVAPPQTVALGPLVFGGVTKAHTVGTTAQSLAEYLRTEFNLAIAASNGFDAVLDFDATLRDPLAPYTCQTELTADGLHPSSRGDGALSLLPKFTDGV
jgi:hypothetical protein